MYGAGSRSSVFILPCSPKSLDHPIPEGGLLSRGCSDKSLAGIIELLLERVI